MVQKNKAFFIGKHSEVFKLFLLGSLLEINTMLAESVNEWTQDWKRQGMQQVGIQNGIRPLALVAGQATRAGATRARVRHRRTHS